MNALVSFTHSIYGWRVERTLTLNPEIDLKPKIVSIRPHKRLVLAGRFDPSVRPGRYCKQPHKLIQAKVN